MLFNDKKHPSIIADISLTSFQELINEYKYSLTFSSSKMVQIFTA